MMETYTTLKSSNFIFSLYLNHTVPSFFAKGLKNTLTGQPMKPSHTFAVAESKKYVVKNIPDYLDLDAYKVHFGQLKHTDVPQYKGFLLNFQNTTTAEDYLLKHLSKRNRKNLKQKQQQLLREHNIKTQWFFGAIDEDSYTQIFKAFYKLLEKRFNEKKMNNRYLKNWAALQTTTYAKIGDKKASLFVIYDHNTPISITLNFHLNDVVFSHIQSYDIAYSHYNMGDISMWHHVQWCIKKKIAIFDLSMGETYNKVKWSNHEYLFYHRMYYQTTSLLEQGWAKFQITKFKWLQLLRDKHIIGGRLSLETLRFKFK